MSLVIKPLPISLLVHTCEIKSKQKDRWGAVTNESSTQLTHIRIEPKADIVYAKDNEQIKPEATLYYDCRLSAPIDFKFKLGDKVIFEDCEYRIVTIKRYTTNVPHHYEVGLSI